MAILENYQTTRLRLHIQTITDDSNISITEQDPDAILFQGHMARETVPCTGQRWQADNVHDNRTSVSSALRHLAIE